METGHPVTRAVRAVTSVFRCRGLHSEPPGADGLGMHDLLYWVLFIALGGAWFLFLFAPQRQRLGLLDGRLDVLSSHLKEEQRELRRLQRGIRDLQRGDPLAWERTARVRLGWLEPGETTQVLALAGELRTPRRPEPALPTRLVPPSPGVRPAPLAPARMYAWKPDTSAVGPLYASPPPIPPLPRVPSIRRTAGIRAVRSEPVAFHSAPPR